MIQVISNMPVGTIGLRAIVPDVEWLENAVKAFGRLMPGEVKVFEVRRRQGSEALVGRTGR